MRSASRACARVLITHSHPDHAGGIPSLLERWPEASVLNFPPSRCHDGEIIAAGDSS